MPRTPTGSFFSRGFSLRTKAFFFVGFAVLAMTAGCLFLASTFLQGSLGRLQAELTARQIDQTIRQIGQVVRQQRNRVLDNAVRDELFDFLKGRNQGGQEGDFDSKTGFAGQDLVLLYDRQKNPFAWLSIPGGLRKGSNPPPGFDADQARHSGLLQEEKTGSAIVATPEGLLVLSAHPVTRSDGSGPSPGWLVYGLNVGPEWFGEMLDVTGIRISPSHPPGAMPGGDMQQVGAFVTDALGECRVFVSQPALSRINPAGIPALIEFQNTIGGAPAELKLTVPSEVFPTAIGLGTRMAWSFAIGGIALTAGCLLAIEWLFIRKIRKLDREFLNLANGGNSTKDPARISRDEFARLAESAHRLLESVHRRRTESRNQENLLLSVLDTSSEGIMAFRSLRSEGGGIADFVIVLANKAAEDIVNRKSEDMLGAHFLALFPATVSEGIFERYIRVVESGIGEEFEVFYGYDGLHSWLHVSAEPWHDGFVVTFGEISSRKRVEEELKTSIEELERFNRAMIGREDRVLEMKSEVNQLRANLGLPPAYKIDASSNDES